jgi:hypothetical protein
LSRDRGRQRGGRIRGHLLALDEQRDPARLDTAMSTEHLEELRRRLAEQTDQGSTNDRVTTDGLAGMRRRLRELKHISENTIDEAEAMSAEEEVHEIMDSLENMRQLRPFGGTQVRRLVQAGGPVRVGPIMVRDVLVACRR